MCGVSMAHRGNRSPEAEARRLIKHEIYNAAFIDKEKAETVCRINPTEVLARVQISGVKLCDVPEVFHGLVLHNPAGKGMFDLEIPEQSQTSF